MVGPNVPSGLLVGDENNRIGRTTDNILTIGEIFGIKNEIQSAGLIDPASQSLFDRI
jgi:hypothetical protein